MKLSRLELTVMQALWNLGGVSAIRQIQEAIPRESRPAYTTVQTIVYRLEAKGAVRRVRKVGNAWVFEPLITRNAAHSRLIDDLLSAFGGRAQPVVAHLVETGRLTADDLDAARRRLEELAASRRKGRGR